MFSPMMDSFTEDFVVLEKTRTPDGEGGSSVVWTAGMKFKAAVSHDSTILAQQAEAQGTASTFTLIVPRTMSLAYPDVIRRVSDNETFQITSGSRDKRTPATSNLNASSVQARKWVLT